jgi:hypothetical protein
MNQIVLAFCILLSTCYCCNLSAQGIGEVAANIYQPISVIISLVKAVSIICGSGLMLGGVLRYFDYRRNPVAVRPSMVFFMFIFGAALIIVGLIPMRLGNY